MPRYWLVIAVDARDEDMARDRARVAALQSDGRVLDVIVEPPQGSTIIGPTHEDALEQET